MLWNIVKAAVLAGLVATAVVVFGLMARAEGLGPKDCGISVENLVVQLNQTKQMLQTDIKLTEVKDKKDAYYDAVLQEYPSIAEVADKGMTDFILVAEIGDMSVAMFFINNEKACSLGYAQMNRTLWEKIKSAAGDTGA